MNFLAILEIGSAGLNVPTNAPESENEQQQAQYFYEGTDEESEQKSQLETDQHCNSIPETDSQQIPVTDCESQPAAVDKTDEHDDGQNQGQDNSFAKLKNRVEGTDYEEETSKEVKYSYN